MIRNEFDRQFLSAGSVTFQIIHLKTVKLGLLIFFVRNATLKNSLKCKGNFYSPPNIWRSNITCYITCYLSEIFDDSIVPLQHTSVVGQNGLTILEQFRLKISQSNLKHLSTKTGYNNI